MNLIVFVSGGSERPRKTRIIRNALVAEGAKLLDFRFTSSSHAEASAVMLAGVFEERQEIVDAGILPSQAPQVIVDLLLGRRQVGEVFGNSLGGGVVEAD